MVILNLRKVTIYLLTSCNAEERIVLLILVVILVCPALPVLSNGMIFPQNATEFPSPIGTVVTYMCNSQFALIGIGSPPQRTCMAARPVPTFFPTQTPICESGNFKIRLYEPLKSCNKIFTTK